MFDRVKLRRDLADCAGRVLARAGTVISVEGIAETARTARPGSATPMADTFVADDLPDVLADPAFAWLFRSPDVRESVRRVVEAAALPQQLVEEMAAAKLLDPVRYRHALSTAVVTARLILATAGTARASPQIAAAALLHDLGMRHVPPRLLLAPDSLHGEDAVEVAQHPILGAFQLARHLGEHPAVEAALAHHWRDGQGYPDLAARPSPTTEVVAVASAFAALTHGRAYRSEPYDARGAVDVLVAEAASGHADPFAVKLLVHALRDGNGEMRGLRFARARHGVAPDVNRHTRIAPPAHPRV
ncbi:MAG TPA: HD domain-containing protein [Anaeromyxobacteraceae bacterium]|nr:HD domain-containing protein [Anaeromyxobacteraceae bacterium]